MIENYDSNSSTDSEIEGYKKRSRKKSRTNYRMKTVNHQIKDFISKFSESFFSKLITAQFGLKENENEFEDFTKYNPNLWIPIFNYDYTYNRSKFPRKVSPKNYQINFDNFYSIWDYRSWCYMGYITHGLIFQGPINYEKRDIIKNLLIEKIPQWNLVYTPNLERTFSRITEDNMFSCYDTLKNIFKLVISEEVEYLKSPFFSETLLILIVDYQLNISEDIYEFLNHKNIKNDNFAAVVQNKYFQYNVKFWNKAPNSKYNNDNVHYSRRKRKLNDANNNDHSDSSDSSDNCISDIDDSDIDNSDSDNEVGRKYLFSNNDSSFTEEQRLKNLSNSVSHIQNYYTNMRKLRIFSHIEIDHDTRKEFGNCIIKKHFDFINNVYSFKKMESIMELLLKNYCLISFNKHKNDMKKLFQVPHIECCIVTRRTRNYLSHLNLFEKIDGKEQNFIISSSKLPIYYKLMKNYNELNKIVKSKKLMKSAGINVYVEDNKRYKNYLHKYCENRMQKFHYQNRMQDFDSWPVYHKLKFSKLPQQNFSLSKIIEKLVNHYISIFPLAISNMISQYNEYYDLIDLFE
jgi:hypothetical protein